MPLQGFLFDYNQEGQQYNVETGPGGHMLAGATAAKVGAT
jgi:hypothetical protein